MGNTINDLQQLRKEFNLAIEDSKKAFYLYEQLTKLQPLNNSMQYAYLGATEALLAKHSFNPFSKLSYVNSAMNKLNKAVSLNINNIEIRYMRFSVEANMPSYLGYNKHIEEDKKILLQGMNIDSITKETCEMYFVFANGIIKSAYCNKEDKILLSNVIDACKQVKQLNK
jgi:hypothetical protein